MTEHLTQGANGELSVFDARLLPTACRRRLMSAAGLIGALWANGTLCPALPASHSIGFSTTLCPTALQSGNLSGRFLVLNLDYFLTLNCRNS
jgi:hypothetical protein